MRRSVMFTLVTSVASIFASIAAAEPLALGPSGQPEPVRVAANNMGGGFVEFLFGGGEPSPHRYSRAEPAYPTEPQSGRYPQEPMARAEPARPAMDPQYLPQQVSYSGAEKPGTIIIDTPRRFLFLVEGNGMARRYGIGVGRPGFSWAGVKQISAKREWPDWRPPEEMLRRRPDLPTFMAGGPENPLGARAMYLGSSLYRIHGSNEPWTIGTAVSSGCIRMRNEDVVDLYSRVKVGTRVIVM
jgi:lipoprotein-anchoring transpeptidase ErfK/SrfK